MTAVVERSVRSELRDLVVQVEALVLAFDASALPGPDDAMAVLRLLGRLRNASGAAMAVAAAHVERTGAFRDSEQESTAHFLADALGMAVGVAREVVETGQRLDELPATADALRSGELSVEQAAIVADCAAEIPAAEGELLECARTRSVGQLRRAAREARAHHDPDPEATHARQVAARHLRHGTTGDGMVWIRSEHPPELGTALVNRLERQADREYRKAYREGRREDHDRYLADALVTLVMGAGKQPKSDLRADVVVHIGYQTLVSGEPVHGEVCMIEGLGTIPVSVAREIARDAFLKGVLIDGTDVRKIRHFGRHINAELRTALAVRSIFEHGDVVCSCGCGKRKGNELDHIEPRADGGATEFANLEAKWRGEHRKKSAREQRERAQRRRQQPGGRNGPDP